MQSLLPPHFCQLIRPLLLLLMWLNSGSLLAQVPGAVPAAPSVGQILNPDGTVRPGSQGSFDARGYQLSYGPGGAPVLRVAAAGDENWQSGFGVPGAGYPPNPSLTRATVWAIHVAANGDIYVGGLFTAVGTAGAAHIARWNGTTWSALGTGTDGPVYAITSIGTDVYVGGSFSTAGNVPAANVARWNGTTWSAMGTGTDAAVGGLAASGTDLYASGNFTTAGGVTVNRIARWNGSAWSALGSGLDGYVGDIAVSGSNVYATGTFTTAGGVSAVNIARWNGSAWSALGTGLNGTGYGLAVAGSNVYVTGQFTTAGGVSAANIARWDGSTWGALGTGLNSYGLTLTTSGTDVYVGGTFTAAGSGGANGIARWNGTAWSALGSGVDRSVMAVAVVGTTVHVGGDFATAGGSPALALARWNGTAWSPVAQGLNADVNCVAVSGSDVYVGGEFVMADGTTANRVVRWNGSTWSALGTGIGGIVYGLAVSGTDVYACGSFTTAGGGGANRIARWNGTAWSALGSGLSGGTPNAVAVIGSTVYVTGSFTTAGGGGANRIARWNGSAWSAMGAGLNGTGNSLTVSGSDLYVGGAFTTAGSVSANRIARWDGTAWNALGTGMNNAVNDIAVFGTDVYAVGDFTTAGGVSANRIARWDGSAWNAIGNNLLIGGSVNAVAVSSAGIFIGGSFLSAGSTSVGNVARWNGVMWHWQGSGLDANVNALKLSASTLYAGGGFLTVADRSRVTACFGVYALSSAAPTITSISPTTGAVGSTVVVTGTNLATTGSVRVNGIAGTITAVSATSISFVVGAGSSTGAVSLTTPYGTATGPTFTLVAPLTVSSVSPTRNLRNAAAASNVAVTFSAPMSNAAASLAGLKVFSNQRGGRWQHGAGGTATVSGNTLTFDPAISFKAGETVYAVATPAAQSTGNARLTTGKGLQFTVAATGTGTANFQSATPAEVAVGNGPYDVAVGDVDGDGDLDLVTANYNSLSGNTVSVRLNDGAGGFGGGSTVTLDTAPLAVALADMDGDGDLDLVTLCQNAGLYVRLNGGDATGSNTGGFSNGSLATFPAVSTQLAVADFDGDGDLDAAVGAGSTVHVRLNGGDASGSGTGVLANGSSLALSFSPAALAAGDVDHDGDTDLVAANFLGLQVQTVLNGGDATGSNTGVFTAGTTATTVNRSNNLTLADVDADGDLDLLAGIYNNSSAFADNRVQILLNGGDATGSATGTFGNGSTVTVGQNPSKVVTADVDADGDLDLLVACDNSASTSVFVARNNGNGTFAAGTAVTVGARPESVAAGDLDGDGDLDFVAANGGSGANSVSVRINRGPAPTISSFTPTSGSVGTSVTITGTNLTAATAARVNGTAGTITANTATSLTFTVGAGSTTGAVSVTTNDGTATGSTFTISAASLTVSSLNPARNLRNAARSSSVAVTFNQSMQNTTATQQAVRVFSQQRGGRMFGSTRGVASVSGSTVTFNPTNDFRPGETLLVTTTTAATSTSGGTLARGHVHQFTAAAGTGPGTFGNGSDLTISNPKGLAVGDVDGDGDLDLVTANLSSNNVNVRLNNGTGAFSGSTSLSLGLGSGPYSVALGDVDGDGDLDFVTANVGNNTASVRLNDGAGTFSGAQDVPVGAGPTNVALGDVDADGDLDLLTANNADGANSVSVRLNDGTGTFSGSQTVPVGTKPYTVAVGDVDADGDLDLLATNSGAGANSVSVRFNDGTGTFSGSQNVSVGTEPYGLALGDVDGDGDLDFVAAIAGAISNPDNKVSVRLNDGTGTFSGSQEVLVNTEPLCVKLGDVEGDGDLDILATTYSHTVSVRLNDGAGLFSGTHNVAVGNFPPDMAVGDVDGDGDLDLLTTNNFNTVNVRLNTPVPTLTSLSPTSGPVGTVVTITGTTLTGATAVRFNGTAAVSFTVNSATQITATVPTGATTGNVTVVTPVSTSNGLPFTVTLPVPTITSFTPTSGSIGTSITITGTNLTGATAARVNGTAGTITANTATSLTFTVGASSTTGAVSVTTPGGTATGSTFTVTNAPTALSLSATSVAENTGANVVVGTFSTTDPDVGNTFTYTLVTGTGSTDNGLVNILGNSLRITASPNFEAKNSYAVRVRTTDNTGLFFEQAFTVTVTNVNEAPTVLSLSPQTVAENTGANAVVGTFSTTDPDVGNTFTYSLVVGTGSTDNGLVNISGNQLRITASPDFETKPSYAVRVRTTDQNGLWLEQAFTVTVTNVNEAPTVLSLSPQTVAENTGANAVVGTFSTTDPDAGNTFTYSLVVGTGSTDNGLVNINGSQLRITASPNFEAKPTYAVRVRTTDQNGLWLEQAFTVTVTNVNEAPTVLSLSPQTVAENVAANTTVGTFSTTDPDVGNTFTYTLVTGTGSTDNGLVNISGSTLRITASPDFETKPSYAIRVRTTDNTGLFTEQAFTITVNDLAEGPGLSSFTPALGPEGTVVTLIGADFTGTTGVSFNGTPAASFTFVSATQLTATVPVGATSGLITVTTGSGSEQTASSFEVLAIYSGTFNSCLSTTAVVSTGSGQWQWLRANNGELVAALNDQGHALGTVSADFYLNQGAIRRDGQGREYFDRNWHLNAQNAFTGQQVRVRFYGRNAEFSAYVAANDGDGNDATSLSQLRVTQYQGANEDCQLANNATGAAADYRLLTPGAPESLGGANWFALETLISDHFSEFFLNGGNSPLPVELIAFAADRESSQAVALTWRTASERQNRGFVVERSGDGRKFTAISELITGQGTTLSAHTYAFRDAAAPSSLVYYRLRQLDADGTVNYSGIIAVRATPTAATWQAYPNPVGSARQLTLRGLSATTAVELLDATGRVVRRWVAEVSAPELSLADLPAGVYVVRVGEQRQRFIIE